VARADSASWFEDPDEQNYAFLQFNRFITIYASYIMTNADPYFAYPSKIASFYDPVEGETNLKRELHRFGLWCAPSCTFCSAGTQKVGFEGLLREGADAFGLFTYLPYQKG
jgi:hypothetical protein